MVLGTILMFVIPFVLLVCVGWIVVVVFFVSGPSKKAIDRQLEKNRVLAEERHEAGVALQERTDAAEVERQVEIALVVKARLAAE